MEIYEPPVVLATYSIAEVLADAALATTST
jgi:hypothetical protein